MLNNYHYFITLAEECNISKAAKKMYISHQCLSKYLKNLEQQYRVSFFDRSPQLKLTPAGQVYLEMLRKVHFLEGNLENQLNDIRLSKKGCIRFGTTEGRYRIMVPDLLTKFKDLYPDVMLDVRYAVSEQLIELVLKNELDIILLNKNDVHHKQLETTELLNEKLFMVISDNMLAEYFPDRYPLHKDEFEKGVDLKDFQQVPFIMSRQGFNSREALNNYLQSHNLHLKCALELTQLDLHFMMSARDYAASFCWSMYIPTIQQMNRDLTLSHLNLFPIRGLDSINQVVLANLKGKILPSYGRDLIHLIKQSCANFTISASDNF